VGGRVWFRPHWDRAIGPALDELQAAFVAGRVWAAIVLVPARTDTGWSPQNKKGRQVALPAPKDARKSEG
jgi:hypothetical protein